MSARFFVSVITSFCVALSLGANTNAADQPQWGESWTRNMVSTERGLPDGFDPETGRNVRWMAKLGSEAHSTPVIAGGRVFIGTNNDEPRDPKHQGDRGVLMCFDEKDGHLLWQLVVPKRDEDPYFDWPKSGISSPVTVDGDRAYVMSNRGEVMCLDVHGMANGNDGPFQEEGAHMTPVRAAGESGPSQPKPGAEIRPETLPLARDREVLTPGTLDADVVWMLDLVTAAGIWPHDGAHTSLLVHGRHLYLNTGTGVDNTHRAIRTPEAPSLIVLDKATGRLVARDDERIASRIFHCTWSSPSLAEVNGRPQIFFAGGDGIVRAFEPVSANTPAGEVAKLKKIWQFDPDPQAPKDNVHRFTGNKQQGPSNILGMPVFSGNRIFVAGGGDIWWGKNEAWLKCVDATRTGDITGDGEVWSYPLNRHVMSTPAVHQGMVFIADTGRAVHCVDADTGQRHWTHEAKGEFWASPLVADGKVYIGSRRGDFWVFAASKEKKVLSSVDLKRPLSATTTAANGSLYIVTMTHLYAFQQGATFQPPRIKPELPVR